jgi:deoxyribose-phosphate aldolase
MSVSAIASLIDHSLLKPTFTLEDLELGCATARQARVATVCLLPYFVGRARELLEGSETLTTTVIAFPHGDLGLTAKLREAEAALGDGAQELDAVVNVSLVLSNEWERVRDEVRALTECCHEKGARLKLIFETCYLTRDQKVRLCEIASEAEVDWVKTSTGFGSGGATAQDVELLRQYCPPTVQVKASGGIGTLGELLLYRDLGATRIGTSRTSAILAEAARVGPLPPGPADGMGGT